jgi:hypothetical protein
MRAALVQEDQARISSGRMPPRWTLPRKDPPADLLEQLPLLGLARLNKDVEHVDALARLGSERSGSSEQGDVFVLSLQLDPGDAGITTLFEV